MPTITLSKKKILDAVGPVPDNILAEKISMLGTDLESVDGDDVVVEIFPNRPDLLSQQGFIRALKSFVGVNKEIKKYSVTKGNMKIFVEKSVKDCRPFTACAVVRGLNLDDNKIKEIITIQEKLHITFGRNRKKLAIGIYPLENIKPPIRFKGLDPKEIEFIPLDYNKTMTADQILKEHPKGKEYSYLLNGLKKYACFVDNDDNIMSLTPIINSELTGKVSENTKDVFIECSGFDLNTLNQCINIIVTALSDLGGVIESCELHYEHSGVGVITTPDLSYKKMSLDKNYVNKILGIELSSEDIKNSLKKMNISYNNNEVIIPPYRVDIIHQIDLVEDIAIGYGYNNFVPEIPDVFTIGSENNKTIINRKIREVLIGHKLIEMKNYHLIKKENQIIKDFVTLKNCVSSEFNTLRGEVISSILSSLSRNKHNEYPQNVFEIGVGFKKDKQQIIENNYLGVILTDDDSDFTKIRQIFDNLSYLMNWSVSLKEGSINWMMKGRCAEIIYNNEIIGYVGEINPETITKFELEIPCSGFLIKLDQFY